MKKNIFILAASVILATSCATTSKSESSTNDLNGEWTGDKIKGTTINKNAGDEIPYLGFDVKQKGIHGCTGCNYLTGSFEVKPNNTIDLSHVGSTRKLCADMTNERLVLNALSSVNSFKADKKGHLFLTDKNGKTVMELNKKK